jgi:hypothetical protein
MGVNYAGSAINNLRIDNRVESNLAVMRTAGCSGGKAYAKTA